MASKTRPAFDLLVLLLLASTTTSASAISHDAATASSLFTRSSPEVFLHTPTGTPRGVVVFIVQIGTADDQITRVAYGGVPLDRIWSAPDSTAEPGRVYGFFLGNAVPPGPQDVSIVHEGGFAVKYASAITLTGAEDVEITPAPGRLMQDRNDPQLALDSGPKAALRYCIVYSGHDSLLDLTPLPGMTPVDASDFGSVVTRIDRAVSASAGVATIGYTATSEHVAMLAVGLAEITVGGGGSGPVPHVAKVVTTPATASDGTLVGVPGASISPAELDSAGIDVGDPVYVQAIAQLGNSASGNRPVMALAHGSTIFQNLDSEPIRPEVFPTFPHIKHTPFLQQLWTRAPGEGLEIRLATVDAGTAQIDQVFLLALGLAGLERNVDWFWSEVGESTIVTRGDEGSGPFTDGASITLVPSRPIDRFAVFTTTYIRHNIPIASKPRTQLTRSGELLEGEPHQGFFGGTAGQTSAMGLMRVYSLSANARNNFALQDNQSSSSSIARAASSVFGLNLDRFMTASAAYAQPEVPLSADAYATRLQTITLQPSADSPVWVGGFWGFNPSSVDRNARFRIRIDDSDDPVGQTADHHQFNGEATDGGSQGYSIAVVTDLTGAPHTIDLDASVDDAADGSGGELASLFAVEMHYAPGPRVPSLHPVGLVPLGLGLALFARYALPRGRTTRAGTRRPVPPGGA